MVADEKQQISALELEKFEQIWLEENPDSVISKQELEEIAYKVIGATRFILNN